MLPLLYSEFYYSSMSGQRINYHKSMVFFSRNIGPMEANTFCDSIGMVRGCDNSHYLGLPFQIGRSKRQIFQFVIDRVRKKLNGWKEKFLTKAGKEILIKSVIQAIQNHIMMCYLLPEEVCDDIMSLVRRFWWGKSCDARSICWKSLEFMCGPKSTGGMGFKDIKATNMSLLGKQGWRILTNPESLFARVFKEKYFPDCDFMRATLGSRPSYLWRSILAGREVLSLGLRYQVGSGNESHVWDEKWFPIPYNFQLHPLNRHKWPDLHVHELMIPGVNLWNEQLLSYLFLPYEVQSILQIPLCAEVVRDQLVWHHTRNGLYTVKSGYAILQRYRSSFLGGTSDSMFTSASLWNKIWNWNTLPKIKHFLWQAMHNILPLGENLGNRVALSISCPHCSCANESDQHLFRDCPYARKVWSKLGLNSIWKKQSVSSFFSFIAGLISEEDESTVSLVFVTLWLLWKARCSMLYDKIHTHHHQLHSNITNLLQELSALQSPNDLQMDVLDSWRKPPLGTYAVNVDASVLDDGRTGYGVIIRNSNGNVISSGAGPLLPDISVENAELLAIHNGIELAVSIQVDKVIIITDSLLAFNRLQSTEFDGSLLSPLVQQIKLLLQKFSSISFELVRRQGNVPAHLLARLALSLPTYVNWGNTPPPDLLHAVNFDSHVSDE